MKNNDKIRTFYLNNNTKAKAFYCRDKSIKLKL